MDSALAARPDAAPLRPLERFARGRPVLVLAPHPDDESLGCGALLAACFATVGAHVVCVTDGRLSHPNSRRWSGDRLAAVRETELIAAVAALGGGPEDVTCLRFRDCHAPADGAEHERAAARIAALCTSSRIGALFAPSARDPHDDHVAVARLARTVRARLPGLRLFDYSIWARWHGTACDPAGEVRFDGRPWVARKAAAIAAHRSQLGQVVDDDPDGFAMPPGFADFFARSDERFREASG